jgi:hypothetical protein
MFPEGARGSLEMAELDKGSLGLHSNRSRRAANYCRNLPEEDA